MNKDYSLKVGDTEMKFSNINIVNAIDSGMVYPTLNSIKDKELKECSLMYEYRCDEISCNFDKCLPLIRESSELKSKGLRDITVIVVQALSQNQQLFTVKEVGGFVLQATGKGQVLVKNVSGLDNPERRYGFIDLTETRRRFIYQYELQKLNSWNPTQVGTGCALGASIAMFAMNLFKKVK